MKRIGNYRNAYDATRKAIMEDLVEVLMTAPDNEIELEDNDGSLIYHPSDDDDPSVVLSIYLRYPKDPVAKVGVYSEDELVPLDDMNIEMILNIADAVKVALGE